MPKVSIVIAAYNAMLYLPQALDCVLEQTFQDFELLIVDDGSHDEIKSWAAQLTDSRIRFFSQENAGSAAARNTGISHATGEYLAFLDSDDWWEPTKLAQQVRILDEEKNVGLVYTWVATMDSDGVLEGKVYQNTATGDVWESLIEQDLLVCGSTPMIRRECFDTVGLFDTRFAYAQTWEMWLRIATKYEFQVIPKVLVHYRFHPNNTSKQWQKVESNYKAIIEKVFSELPEERQSFKGRCYGHAYLRTAWKMLQNQGGDCAAAKKFRETALNYCPDLKFSDQCIRLSIALVIVQTLGLERYENFRNLFQHLKYQAKHFPKALISPSST